MEDNQQQQHRQREQQRRCASPALRYLNAIQTNKGNTNTTNANADANTSTTVNHTNVNVGNGNNSNTSSNASMKRPRPPTLSNNNSNTIINNNTINNGTNINMNMNMNMNSGNTNINSNSHRPPPPPPQSSILSSPILASTPTRTQIYQHQHQHQHLQQEPFQNELQHMQSRNGSTSPSRGRMMMTRSESYTTNHTRDSASYSYDQQQQQQYQQQQQQYQQAENYNNNKDHNRQEGGFATNWEEGDFREGRSSNSKLKSNSKLNLNFKPISNSSNLNSNQNQNQNQPVESYQAQNQNQMQHSTTTSYRRQWTPNQWRNFRTIQQIDQQQQQQHAQPTPQHTKDGDKDKNNRDRLESIDIVNVNTTTPSNSNSHVRGNNNSNSSNNSRTETDVASNIATNKAFDLKRRQWSNANNNNAASNRHNLKTPSSSNRSNNVTPSWKIPKHQQHDFKRKQQHQQQNLEEGESDFIASEETNNEPKKPLHHNININAASTVTSFKKSQSSNNLNHKLNNLNTTSITSSNGNGNVSNGNTPSPSSISPTVVSSRKWQKKVLNDRGWIKNKITTPNSTNLNMGNNVIQVENVHVVGLGGQHQGTSNSSSLTSFTEYKIPNQNQNQSQIQNQLQQRPSSPSGNSLESIPVRKITSMWIDRVNRVKTNATTNVNANVNTTSTGNSATNSNSNLNNRRKTMASHLVGTAVSSKHTENEVVEQIFDNDAVKMKSNPSSLSLSSLPQPQDQTPNLTAPVEYNVKPVVDGANANIGISNGNIQKHVWGGVKLRRVKEVIQSPNSNHKNENEIKSKKIVDHHHHPQQQHNLNNNNNDDNVMEDSIIEPTRKLGHIEEEAAAITVTVPDRDSNFKATSSINYRIKKLSGKNNGSVNRNNKNYSNNGVGKDVSIPVESHNQQVVSSTNEDKTPRAKNMFLQTNFRRLKNSKVPSNEGAEDIPQIDHAQNMIMTEISRDKVQQVEGPSSTPSIEILPEKEDNVLSNPNGPIKDIQSTNNPEFQSVRSRLRSWNGRKSTGSYMQPVRVSQGQSSPVRHSTGRSSPIRHIIDRSSPVRHGLGYASPIRHSIDRSSPVRHSIGRSTPVRLLQINTKQSVEMGPSFDENRCSKPNSMTMKEQGLDIPSERNKKTANISFGFTSIKQRIKSLSGDIHTPDDNTEKNIDENGNQVPNKEIQAQNINVQDNTYLDTKQNDVEIPALVPSTTNRSWKKSARTFMKSSSQTVPRQLLSADNQSTISPRKSNRDRCHDNTIEHNEPADNDNCTVESKGIKSIKSLFENGTANSPSYFRNKKQNEQHQTRENFTPPPVEVKFLEGELEHKCTSMDENLGSNAMKALATPSINLARNSNKISLSKSADRETGSIGHVESHSTDIKPQNSTDELRDDGTYDKDETIDKVPTVFSNIRSKFEKLGQAPDKSSVHGKQRKANKHVFGSDYTVSSNISSSTNSPSPQTPGKRNDNDHTNNFRSIEMLNNEASVIQIEEERKPSSFSDLDTQQLNDQSPESNMQYDRNLETPPNDNNHYRGCEPNHNMWSSSERNNNSHDHKVHIDISDEIVNASYDSYPDDEDCDGVTLSPTTSDVSSLSIPTCLQSVETSTEFESSSSSDEDTGAMESGTDKQSSAKGASEASSSHTSEAATPLIHSTLRSMHMTMGRLTSHSDSTHSIDIKQVTGLLGTIPPLKEDNSYEEGLLLKNSQIPSQSSLNIGNSDNEVTDNCKDADFVPGWEAKFFDNNSDDSSQSHQWEAFTGYNDQLGSFQEKIGQHHNKSAGDESNRSSSLASSSNISSSSSRIYRMRQGIGSEHVSEVQSNKQDAKQSTISEHSTQLQPKRSTNTVEEVKSRSLSLKDKNSAKPFSNESNKYQKELAIHHSLKSALSDRENKAPSVIRKQIFKSTVNLKSASTSRRFDKQKVKAYQLARRKSFDRLKQNNAK